jgi:hypothetical protein
MYAFTKPLLAVAMAIVATIAPALADVSGSPDESRTSITAIGNGKTFIGDCTGRAVRLDGDRQTVMLLGKCKSIVSHGSYKHITFDGATSLRMTGDGNTVKWKAKPDSVITVGHKNLLTRA